MQFYCLEWLFLPPNCCGPFLISRLVAGIQLVGFRGHSVAMPSTAGLLGPVASGFLVE